MKSNISRVVIITDDTLQAVGLQSMLSDYFPHIEIEAFSSVERYVDVQSLFGEYFCVYFIDAPLYALYVDNFISKKDSIVLLTHCESKSGIEVLNTRDGQEDILRRLGEIFTRMNALENAKSPESKELTNREIEVLKLAVCGKINKEIAEELSISFQTVLSHRKNIASKLGIKTLSGLTFYALNYGYIKPQEIKG